MTGEKMLLKHPMQGHLAVSVGQGSVSDTEQCEGCVGWPWKGLILGQSHTSSTGCPPACTTGLYLRPFFPASHFTLKTEATWTSETKVSYSNTIQYCNPGHFNLKGVTSIILGTLIYYR